MPLTLRLYAQEPRTGPYNLGEKSRLINWLSLVWLSLSSVVLFFP